MSSSPTDRTNQDGWSVRTILLILLATRGTLFVFAFIAHVQSIPRWWVRKKPVWHAFESFAPLDLWSRWDAGYYAGIARDGYEAGSVVFYPFYPFLIRVVDLAVGHAHLSGLIVSNLCLAAASVALYRFAQELLDERAAKLGLLAILLFPSSMFLSAGYSESTFLLLSVLACWAYHRGFLVRAALLGGAAALTRTSGMLLFPAFALDWLVKHRTHGIQTRLKSLWLLIIPAGFLVYPLLQYLSVGDPLAFLTVQKEGWGRQISEPITPIAGELTRAAHNLGFEIRTRGHMGLFYARSTAMRRFVELAVALSFLFTTIALMRHYPLYLSLYALLSLLLPIATGTLLSIDRFVVVIFPVFMKLGQWMDKSQVLRFYLLFLFVLFLGLYTTQFANAYFTG